MSGAGKQGSKLVVIAVGGTLAALGTFLDGLMVEKSAGAMGLDNSSQQITNVSIALSPQELGRFTCHSLLIATRCEDYMKRAN